LLQLQEKTPVGSVVIDQQFWPTTDTLDDMHQQDGSTFKKKIVYKANWAIFSQLQAFESAGHGCMARAQTRWMAVCRWRFYFTEATTHTPHFA